MQACEKRVPPSSGAILTPIIVNFAENGTFWPSVKHNRKNLYYIDMPHKAYVYLLHVQSSNICQGR